MFDIFDKSDWKVLNLIADNPYKKFYLREIAKKLSISSSSVKKALDRLKKFNLIKEEKLANLRIIFGNIDDRLLKQIKITKNIEFITPLIEKLEPSNSIILFGSYAKGENDAQSDIDLCIITNKKEDFNLYEYKGYKVQIVKLTSLQWMKMKKENPALVQEIKKGVLLKGEIA